MNSFHNPFILLTFKVGMADNGKKKAKKRVPQAHVS